MADGKVQDDQDQQDSQGGQQEGAQAQGQGEGTPQVLGTGDKADAKGADAPAPDYEKQLAERDKRIQELETKVAEAAKTAEAAERLRGEIADLRKASEDERLDFSLKLAGCRNVKAARAVLEDYKGDVEALKAGEPWLFSKGEAAPAATGSTGLPNAGASSGSGDLKRWERLAGLTKEE